MSVIEVFQVVSNSLIEIMFVVCGVTLILRFIAHRQGRINKIYFNTFSRSIVKILEDEESKDTQVEDIDIWLENLLNQVEEHLPDRSLRFKGSAQKRQETLADYTGGKRSVVIAMKQQVDALKSPHPPNFGEIADRILNQDRQWRAILRVIPIDSLARGLDILPNLFIVGGIFGTFIGITNALPLIASIDLTKLAESAPILNEFVANVAYSMNTSIAGIVFSVIMTIVISLFPLTSVREDVHKNFERAIEFTWYRLHGDNISRGEQKLISALETMTHRLVTSLEEIKTVLSTGSNHQQTNENTGSVKKAS